MLAAKPEKLGAGPKTDLPDQSLEKLAHGGL
jgi:hypothetical protein